MTPVFHSDLDEPTKKEKKETNGEATREECVCKVCGQQCYGETLLRREDKSWIHENCFKCATCHNTLNPNAYYVSDKNLIYLNHIQGLKQSQLSENWCSNSTESLCNSQMHINP